MSRHPALKGPYPRLDPFHRLWHRDKRRSCLVCRFVWWRLSRDPRVKVWLAELDARNDP